MRKGIWMRRCDRGAPKTASRLTRLAMLTTLALIIFVIELQIPNPIPIPGVKLSLANIITVYVVYRYTAREAAMVVLARVLLAAIINGNMSALIYSLAGSALCILGMLAVRRILTGRYLWLSSVIGAILHNTGQMIAALLIAGHSALVYYPFLLVSGCLTGAFTGICAQLILRRHDGMLAPRKERERRRGGE